MHYFFLFMFIYDSENAPSDEVQNVIALANGSPEASRIVKESLLRHPVPTRYELRTMRTTINEMVTLDLARKVTGDPTLQSPSGQSKATLEASTAHEKAERARLDAKKISEMSIVEIATFFVYRFFG